jgi:hypothetical protein
LVGVTSDDTVNAVSLVVLTAMVFRPLTMFTV